MQGGYPHNLYQLQSRLSTIPKLTCRAFAPTYQTPYLQTPTATTVVTATPFRLAPFKISPGCEVTVEQKARRSSSSCQGLKREGRMDQLGMPAHPPNQTSPVVSALMAHRVLECVPAVIRHGAHVQGTSSLCSFSKSILVLSTQWSSSTPRTEKCPHVAKTWHTTKF